MPPPLRSKLNSAALVDAYIGASAATQDSVAELQRLALQRAPALGSVVLIHTLPVATPFTVPAFSEILYAGIEVCGDCCSLGARYVPTIDAEPVPVIIAHAPVPSVSVTLPWPSVLSAVSDVYPFE